MATGQIWLQALITTYPHVSKPHVSDSVLDFLFRDLPLFLSLPFLFVVTTAAADLVQFLLLLLRVLLRCFLSFLCFVHFL